jgi:hypothetical protein
MEIDDVDVPVDNKALAKLKANGEDDTPLMTEAMRKLLKAQKELVYSRTLIKIRYSRVCIPWGRFRHNYSRSLRITDFRIMSIYMDISIRDTQSKMSTNGYAKR